MKLVFVVTLAKADPRRGAMTLLGEAKLRREAGRQFLAAATLRILLTAAGLLSASVASAVAGQVDRLYVIDCGWAHASDQSLWSPGVNVGVPIDFSNNCYLIHHSSEGYLLWDTGITDRLAAVPDGVTNPALGQTWHRTQTLMAVLATLAVKPADVRYVAISHVHPDHAGNVEAFPEATLIIQMAEWEHAMALPQKPFSPDHQAMKLSGDKDLFGDGSLTILSTPGHTPGHQSLLVHLEKTSNVVLSGDVVHFQSNWDNRRIPSFNSDKVQSAASLEKIARVLAESRAQLWINHDKPSNAARRQAPEFYR
jgi:glyoxylase-like metal-dependent hydrolase (beta-lactamase superfamily II)